MLELSGKPVHRRTDRAARASGEQKRTFVTWRCCCCFLWRISCLYTEPINRREQPQNVRGTNFVFCISVRLPSSWPLPLFCYFHTCRTPTSHRWTRSFSAVSSTPRRPSKPPPQRQQQPLEALPSRPRARKAKVRRLARRTSTHVCCPCWMCWRSCVVIRFKPVGWWLL